MEVEPIRNLADIAAIHRVLTKWGNVREAEAFIIGSNFALRGADLMRTTVEQTQADFIIVSGGEGKTGKFKRFPINHDARAAINRLLAWYRSQEIEPVYLFQGTGNRAKGSQKPLSTKYLYTKLKEAVESLALDVNIGNHTMRKNMIYHAYINGVDIHYLQALLNHAEPKTTLAYIGITRKTIEDVYLNFGIGIK